MLITSLPYVIVMFLFAESILGLINDDSNEVGQVHLGVVHLFTLESDAVSAAEDNIENLEFLTLSELSERRESLETWSQICLDGLLQLQRGD